MKIYIIILLILTCPSAMGQDDNEKIVNEFINKYNGHKSLSYNIDYSIKTFDDEEPILVETFVMMQKIKEDTIFGGKFLYEYKVEIKDSTLYLGKYYDAKNLYVIRHNEKEIWRYNSSKGEDFPITSRFDGQVIRTYFLRPEDLSKTLESEKNQINYSDTANFVKIIIHYPDDEDTNSNEKQLYVNKLNKTIDRITFQAKYLDQIQKNQWLLTDIVFDTIQENTLENRVKSYFENYEIKDFEMPSEEDYKLMDFGETAPTIEGKLFPDYSKNVEIIPDKITVLDFWFSTCQPCIKAIPHLNRLNKKYKDQIQIIGVNDIDNDPKDKKKMEAFLNRTPIDYQVLLVDSIPKEYNIIAYPTLYIIGKDSKVKYTLMSYSDDLFEKLDEVLYKLVNE